MANVVGNILREAESNPSPGENQGHIPFSYHLIPPIGLAMVAKVMHQGAIDHPNSGWKSIDPLEHINHAISHLVAYLGGMRGEDHLAHAACRILFAIEMAAEEAVEEAVEEEEILFP